VTGSSAMRGTPLTSGVPVSGIAGGEYSERLYRITVPAGATRLEVQTVGTSGASGDVDLYLRRGLPPADGVPVDCGSETPSSRESCVIENPVPGEWFILLLGYTAYSGVTLTATVRAGP